MLRQSSPSLRHPAYLLLLLIALTFTSSFSPPLTTTDDVINVDDQYQCNFQPTDPLDCSAPELIHTLMLHVIQFFPDVHVYKFGKPVPGDDPSTCHMAWRFHPIDPSKTRFQKDYRTFTLSRSPNCTYSVTAVGPRLSGQRARKMKLFDAKNRDVDDTPLSTLHAVKHAVDPVENKFINGKYLFYSGGGDRCKSMEHYLHSLLCALGEARFLNRTFVMDMSVCLPGTYTSSKQDEEGRDFRFYFDPDCLREGVKVMDHRKFWSRWMRWEERHGLEMYIVENYRDTPMKVKNVKDTLLMRKFGDVEPDNYWYRVCQGETARVIQRPWEFIRKSSRLTKIGSEIAKMMGLDFDTVHVNVVREEMKDLDFLVSTLKRKKVAAGRKLYIASDDGNMTFLIDALKGEYKVHVLDDFRELWSERSRWYRETSKMNDRMPVEFDGYMRMAVDREVFLKGKLQIEMSKNFTIGAAAS